MTLMSLLSASATELKQCVHLLDRTSFGVDTKTLGACLEDEDYNATLYRLLSFPEYHEPSEIPDFALKIIKPYKKFKYLNVAERKALNKMRRERKRAMKVWWMQKLLTTQTPFEEKMVLFWHNHFTSSLQKVAQPALIYRQNQLFRRYALGNFGDLLHAIIEDPAMLVYLDNRANRKKHPNENLARELLELFTLGEGHYSEHDIKALARALTGYSLDKNMNFKFKKKMHDYRAKEFLGHRGNFDGHQMVDIILDQNTTSLYLVGKLWKAFVSCEPNPQEVKRLAKLFRKNNYEMKPLMQAMLSSSYFTDTSARGKMIKSPIDLIVGTLRSFDYQDFDPKIALQYSRRLGQDLLNPPNVKGWPGGKKWINANTFLTRKEFLYRLMRAKEKKHLDYTLFQNSSIASTSEEAAAKTLLPINIFITPAHQFDATLQTILQHPLYQLK